ncbi:MULTISPECIES: YqjD family protein [Rubrivivax]|uniref:DUF883 family protein n=1 Tax=Rubrivivax benzoatilyticus TaxID=316997 RepID=A0ABX0HTR8_9BURK|nr:MULTISPECIES: DUF883 family protein [Rubrivivax]EGJ10394.1 hypothetical protein RBXJA2T_08710 [Rubrivivax benzoatilyticus JA2 = ATCC BAA-35]MCC9597471.1 DUF883 family protein [Rubrivivax sp. JA1055]MCC9646271.1 DUF883 family protein [Rubrivivax sp. JA1029]NHK98414.1 DUF883 family protein [Rubrivivax benzoatilyticus]NHL23811.1 DUF883 family protein [Rubrivivax benzoatilyticus]
MTSTPDDTPRAAAAATAGSPDGRVQQDELLQRVVQGAHETIDRLADRAAPHVSRLHDGVHDAQERLHAKADALRETGDEWTESLRETVREHPIAAIATALAVGVLIARLTR